jgi:hypothetical protein
MKRLSRDSWLAIGLFLLLLLITIIAAIQQTKEEEEAPPLSSFSSAPNGARALRLWLENLDYSVSDKIFSTFRLPEDTGLALMLEPFVGITLDEWQEIDAWVEEGGTLVLAGDGFGTVLAARHYQFNLAYLDPPTTSVTAQTPLLVSPPASPANAHPRAYLETDRNDFVTHLAVEGQPVLVSFEREAGRVILSAAAYPFSNAGLKEDGNPALVLNLISTSNQPAVIWFDEWHHGLRAGHTEIVGPGNWLRYTPTGRSLLYTAAVIFVALLLRGRRFGRPVPLAKDTARRAPLEYITAIANLGRRAGHRSAVLRQYHQWLKRGLGQRYRLNPTLPDKEYLEQLAQFNPNLDTPALRSLLGQLQRRNVSESDMIQLAAEVATQLKES